MLENVDYCPVLHTRISEIKALFNVPAVSKDRMFPLIVARPWPNANRLQRTWEKVTEAFGQRRFALDLDPFKRGAPTSKPAGAEFNALFDNAGGYINYYQALQQIPGAIPVLRANNPQMDANIRRELENVDRLGRGLVVRLSHDDTPDPVNLLRVVKGGGRRFVLFVDLGWSPDVLGRVGWASRILREIDGQNDSIEVAICGSSFPENFTRIGERGEVRIAERFSYDELVRQHNQLDLKYGDWGSSRPPREATPMTPVPRIDLSLSRQWICFRQIEEETYADIARRVIADHEWPNGLSIWATYTIECTANELPGMIRSPATAAAARINLHLYRQANFGGPAGGATGDTDEPFTDD